MRTETLRHWMPISNLNSISSSQLISIADSNANSFSFLPSMASTENTPSMTTQTELITSNGQWTRASNVIFYLSEWPSARRYERVKIVRNALSSLFNSQQVHFIRQIRFYLLVVWLGNVIRIRMSTETRSQIDWCVRMALAGKSSINLMLHAACLWHENCVGLVRCLWALNFSPS